MKSTKRTAFLAAAAIAVPSVVFAQEAPPQPSIDNKQPLMDGAIRTSAIQLPDWPAGFIPRPVEEKASIFRPIAKATEAAITDNGFDEFVQRLSEPDRKRIMKDDAARKESEDLNHRISRLREKFRQKYDADFNLNDPARVFDAPVQVAQAEVSDPNLAVDRFPVAASLKTDREAQMASGRIDRINPRFPDDGRKTNYLGMGKKVAIVCLPSDDLSVPGVNASLSHEFLDQWKLDIPDSVTGQRLHDNLLRELTRLDENSANWPGNMNDAKRLFVQHVLAAAYDLPTAPPTTQPKAGSI